MCFNYFCLQITSRSGIGEATLSIFQMISNSSCLGGFSEVWTTGIPLSNEVWGTWRETEPGWVARDSALTWFVLLALGGDGEGMHIQPQVPGHGVQQQHREGPVRVGVVQQSAQLPALQPVATHISLGVQEGHWQGLCVEQGQESTPPRGKGHSPPPPLPRPHPQSRSRGGNM